MRARLFAAAVVAALFSQPALAQTEVVVGISGWTGFAPLTLAKDAGIFEKNGVIVDIKKIPQKDRHLAIASGDIQCAATTVETFLIWNASGVPIKQVVQLDMSHGADGMAVRSEINSIAELKGKTVAASAPGTSPYFVLAWMLRENGLKLEDVTIANLEPAAAAQAFVAGQNDAAMTYEPYLSTVRDNPEAGKIIATTVDYPVVTDTFGCTPEFIEANPEAVQAMVKSYYEALEMIETDQAKAYEIMGADVKQSAEEFGKSAAYLRWQGPEENKAFFNGGIQDFSAKAGELLMEIGIIKEMPKIEDVIDTRFIDAK